MWYDIGVKHIHGKASFRFKGHYSECETTTPGNQRFSDLPTNYLRSGGNSTFTATIMASQSTRRMDRPSISSHSPFQTLRDFPEEKNPGSCKVTTLPSPVIRVFGVEFFVLLLKVVMLHLCCFFGCSLNSKLNTRILFATKLLVAEYPWLFMAGFAWWPPLMQYASVFRMRCMST